MMCGSIHIQHMNSIYLYQYQYEKNKQDIATHTENLVTIDLSAYTISCV